MVDSIDKQLHDTLILSFVGQSRYPYILIYYFYLIFGKNNFAKHHSSSLTNNVSFIYLEIKKTVYVIVKELGQRAYFSIWECLDKHIQVSLFQLFLLIFILKIYISFKADGFMLISFDSFIQ